MSLVIADDERLPWWGVAAPSSQVVTNAGPRILVQDECDVSYLWGHASAALCEGNLGVMTATYDDSVARVDLSASGLEPFTHVRVERSTDQQHWTTIRGAADLEITAGAFTHSDYEFVPGVVNYYRVITLAPFGCSTDTTASVTPDLTQVWLKSVTRPFLNTPLGTGCSAMGASEIEMLVDNGDVVRPTRAGIFPIINRTLPVGVTDLALGRTWPLRMRTWTTAGLRTLDYLFASGDILFIQVPFTDCAETIEHGYVIAQDPSYQRHHRYRQRVVWQTELQEVATPGPDIAYRDASWATVLTQFGSWAAVIAACPTWNDVLALLPDPSEVIVP